jgi:hypothetical protein
MVAASPSHVGPVCGGAVVVVVVGAVVVVVVGAVVVVVVGAVVVVVGAVVVVVGAVVVVVGAVVVVVVTSVTPQTDWPMIRSPAAVGPRRYRWAALTVIVPSELTTCSLKTALKLSPTLSMVPLYLVLGAGLAGRLTTVSSPSTSGFPPEVTS